MSFNHHRALFKMEPIWANPTEFATLVVLADFANRDGEAWPSQPTIAKRIGVGPRHVWNITKSLAAKGLILIEPGAAPRGGKKYTLLFEPVTVEPRSHSEKPPTVEPRSHDDETATVAPSFHSRTYDHGTSQPLTVELGTRDAGTHVPQPWNPSSTNPISDPLERDPSTEPASRSQSRSLSQEDEDRKHRDLLRTKDAAMRLVGRFSTKEELADAVRKELDDVDPATFSVGIQFAWIGRMSAKSNGQSQRTA